MCRRRDCRPTRSLSPRSLSRRSRALPPRASVRPSSRRSIIGPFADSASDSVPSPSQEAQLRPNDTSSLPNEAFMYDSPKSIMPDVFRSARCRTVGSLRRDVWPYTSATASTRAVAAQLTRTRASPTTGGVPSSRGRTPAHSGSNSPRPSAVPRTVAFAPTRKLSIVSAATSRAAAARSGAMPAGSSAGGGGLKRATSALATGPPHFGFEENCRAARRTSLTRNGRCGEMRASVHPTRSSAASCAYAPSPSGKPRQRVWWPRAWTMRAEIAIDRTTRHMSAPRRWAREAVR